MLVVLLFFYRDKVSNTIRVILLPENVVFLKNRNEKIILKFNELVTQKKIHLIHKDNVLKEELEKQVNEMIHIANYVEQNTDSLYEVYKILSFGYFYKTILLFDLQKDIMLKQLITGFFPEANDQHQIEETVFLLKKYTKKTLAISNEEDHNLLFLDVYSDILYYKILNISSQKKLNYIDKQKILLFLYPYYEWLYLLIFSNFGLNEKIQLIFQQNSYWEFSEEEKLLLVANAFFYRKDYYKLFQTFLQFQNLQKQIPTLPNEQNQNFIHASFYLLLAESFLLQKNYIFSKYYLEQIERLYPDQNQKELKERIQRVRQRLKNTFK